MLYPRALPAICCPLANTPADVSASPGSDVDGQGGGNQVGRGGGDEGFFYPGRVHQARGKTDLGVRLDGWWRFLAEGGLRETQ